MVSKGTNLIIPWETKNSNVAFYLKNVYKFLLFSCKPIKKWK